MISFVNVAVPRSSFSLRAAVAKGIIDVDGPGTLTAFEGFFSADRARAQALYNDYLDNHELTGLRSAAEIMNFTRASFLPGLLAEAGAAQARIHFEIDGARLTIETGSGAIIEDVALRESDWLVKTNTATMSAWMRSFMPFSASPPPASIRPLALQEAISARGGSGCPSDYPDDNDCADKSGPCVANTSDPSCWLDLCWFLNEAPSPEPGCTYEGCGSDNCSWDACGGDACGGAACGVDACGGAACGADGCGTAICGADGCGGNICGADGGPVGACPANACPANVG